MLFAQAGTLDPTFGTGGKVTIPIGNGDNQGYSVALQSDGKIVVAGNSYNSSNSDIALVRCNNNGSLDNTFGTGGIVTTSVGSNNDFGYSVALQSDGKILVAGYSSSIFGADFALMRYNNNGSLDPAFGTSGKVTTPIGIYGDEGYSLALQSDGKIVVAGYSYSGTSNDFALVRYDPNGSLDATFGTSGKVTTPIGNNADYGYSVALQSDGKIIVAGHFWSGSTYDLALTRYNNDGSLDNTFGTGGIVTIPTGNSNDGGYSVALQSDGKIVLAGYSSNTSDNDFALLRCNSDGSLDNTFGTGGKVIMPLGSNNDYGRSVALQSDGKILVAGYSSNGSDDDFALLRCNIDGSFDGLITTPIGNGNDYGRSVVLQSDKKIVVAGYSSNGLNMDFALVRYDTNSVTSITDVPLANKVLIVPNPNRGEFIIQVAAAEDNRSQYILEIHNVFGELVFSSEGGSASGGQTTVNPKGYSGALLREKVNLQVPNGIYFLHLETEQGPDGYRELVKKIIIQK